jgi:hypothetical protein
MAGVLTGPALVGEQPARLSSCETIESAVLGVSAEVASKAEASAALLPIYTDEQLGLEANQYQLAAGLAGRNPGWTAFLASLASRFDRDGLVLVRGLAFDPENRLLVGLLAGLGRVSGDGNPRGLVVFDLFTKERLPDKPDFELFFHTGSYFRPRPHEVLALLCVQPGGEGGGISKLARLDSVLTEMERRSGQSAAIETLQRPACFKRPKRFGGGFLELPILSPLADGTGRLMVRFERRRVIAGAAGRPGGDPELLAAVEAFEQAATASGIAIEHRLAANELLIVDNRRVLHARGEVPGGRSAGRHLKRVKAYRP